MKKLNSKARFWVLYHVGLLIISAIISLVMKYHQTGNALHPTAIVAFLTILLMSASIGYMTIFMVNKAKEYNQPQINKKILPALLIFYIIAYLIANLSITIGNFVWFLYSNRDLSEFWAHLFKYELTYSSKQFFIWLMFFTIAFFYILWQKSVNKEQKLREENLKYKYQNLKSQVNPHFLFNSLNTLSEIVYEDAKKADNYIQKLSGIYRYILENEENDLIPLDRELEFVKQYFSLQKDRNNDKILLEMDFQNTGRFKIMPVSLQILVENALKHNSMSQESPLKIQIYNSNGYVVVSNVIQKKNIFESSPQTGLLNLRERAKLIMGKELIVTQEDNYFTVKLPVIETCI
ncbi:MAG: histidine kinase [Bacteroidales bacterium]|nr:histidine kinase [Bacteroidales bacterium]